MCGIFGHVEPSAPTSFPRTCARARQLLRHRGPDQEGQLLGRGWALAHCRLSIFDPAATARQPFRQAGFALVFNGAIYNFPELRQQLEQRGYNFTTRSDTEVVLQAYRAWGVDCFARFNGMWAIGIIDPERQCLVLSRDRFGIKPLYWSRNQDRILFASEPRVIRDNSPDVHPVNPVSAYEFIQFGWQDHRPESLYQDIEQFPPATTMRFSLDDLSVQQNIHYYQLPERTSPVSSPERIALLRQLLVDSVRLRTRADVPYGLTLSGGLDSSGIAGIIAQSPGPRPPTFSALFPDTAFDETPYVQAVRRFTGLKNYGFRPDWEQFMADWQQCQFHQDQPLASLAVVSHFGLMRQLHTAGLKVLLNGQGADEIGAGYEKFYRSLLRENGWRNVFSSARAIGFYFWQNGIAPTRLFQKLHLQRPTAAINLLRADFRLNSRHAFVRPAVPDVRATSTALLRHVGLPVLLRHEDRNTMAFALESRTPFLDFRVVDLLLAAPASFHLAGGVRKAGLRQALAPFLPQEVLRRHRKLGFSTPQNAWMAEHPDFFLRGIRAYVSTPDSAFRATTLPWCAEILQRKNYRFFDRVWRIWSWSVFCLHNE